VVAADNKGAIIQPQQQPRQQQQQQHHQQRSLQEEPDDGTDISSTYWWHDNLSDEKDIVYQTIIDGSDGNNGGEVAFSPENQMKLNSGNDNGSSNGENDNGKSGFSVYSIAVSNDPDTSNLPHHATTKIVKYYPLWGVDFNGCASSSNPPETYLDNNGVNNEEGGVGVVQYLFDKKLECCIRWFQEDLNGCVRTSQVEEMEAYQDSLTTGSADSTTEPSTHSPIQHEIVNYHAAVMSERNPPRPTTVLYEEYFENGSIHNTNPENEYFAWGHSGNGQWSLAQVVGDGWRNQVATISGSGKFAMASTLTLTIGGNVDSDDDDTLRLREVLGFGGAYINFDVRADVGFPLDSLEFRVNDKILGYWPTPSNGWERIAAYIPPRDGLDYDGDGMHELTWTYSYYGSGNDDDEDSERAAAVQLDDLTIEATTGDMIVTDQKLLHMEYGTLPALNAYHSSGDSGWDVLDDDDRAYEGYLVLGASTRKIIIDANSIDTYHGTAVMSVTIVTGQFGGTLRFATNADVRAPVDVLEVGVDGEAILAVTEPDYQWKTHALELQPGRRVVTFAHIANPSRLSIVTLEGMGQPGSSKVDGLHYEDHVDPRLLTSEPTGSPTRAPSGVPTPFTIRRQNYCGTDLLEIKNVCYTDGARTCNSEDDPCPLHTFCWGNVECDIPMQFLEQMRVTQTPTVAPAETPLASPFFTQNYCGTSLGSIKEECASGTLDTCNEADAPCPQGTFCWGNIVCQVPEDPPPAPTLQNYCGTSLDSIKASCASGVLPTCNGDDGPCATGTYCWGSVKCDAIATNAPTVSSSEETVESFLDSFFSINTGSGSSSASQDEVEAEVQDVQISSPAQVATVNQMCPEGTSSAPGLPNCCVPDPSFLGDGACDAHPPYNTADCGYDLGDCCRGSCDPSSSFGCNAKEGDAYGPFGYYCIDPRHGPSVDEDACSAENREWVVDGGCDPEYNTAECGWDGGDCCRQSCDPSFAFYECGREAQPFDCKDPDIIYRADYVP